MHRVDDLTDEERHRLADQQRAAELAAARERERIAGDLHDTVGQIFYGLCLKTESCLALDPADPGARERLTEEIQAIRRLAAEGVGAVRAAVYSLGSLHAKADGIVPSLRRLVADFSRGTGVQARFQPIAIARRRISDDVESALYRVAHEALVNVDRHARATGVVVSLEVTEHWAELSVVDDGVGLDQRQVPDWRSAPHFGLRTMAQSIHELGGRFEVRAVSPRGLLIRARAPLFRRASGREAAR